MSKSSKGKPRLTEAQILLGKHLEELGFSGYSYEYRFNPQRKWLADIAYCALPGMIFLFECDGGKWSGGHKRGQALEDDYERQNWAIAHGFKLFRFTNQQVESGYAKSFIARELLGKKDA